MKGSLLSMLFMLAALLNNNTRGEAQTPAPESPSNADEHVHVRNTFRFEVAAPMARVAPLFGPEAERSWAGKHWDPVFLYPSPGRDVEGAVFRVKRGPLDSLWVNTLFDVPGGRMQYVSVVPDQVATTVDVRVTALSSSRTSIEVIYARTALNSAANDEVRQLGANDRGSGPEWQRGVETALGLIKE